MCGRLLAVAFLPIMAASIAVLKVGLVTITVRTCADGDGLLTLLSRLQFVPSDCCLVASRKSCWATADRATAHRRLTLRCSSP